MNRERPNTRSEPVDPPAVPGSPSPQLEGGTQVLHQGLALLEAADQAINRALSRDSRQYLAQGRQSGGQ